MKKDTAIKYAARFALWEIVATVITVLIGMTMNARLMGVPYYDELPPVFNWEVFLAVNVGMVVFVIGVGLIGLIGLLAFFGTSAFNEDYDE